MLAVRHFDLQLLLQGQIKKFDSFLDQSLPDGDRDWWVLDIEKADIDNCSSERLQELWFCCNIIGKSEVQQRDLTEGSGVVGGFRRGRDLEGVSLYAWK